MASKPQTENKSQMPQASAYEAQLLYQNIDRLQTVQDERELLEIVAAPGLSAPPGWAALYKWSEAGWQAQPVQGEVVAVWSAGQPAPLAAGASILLAEFPLLAAWSQSPAEPLFIPDIDQDKTIIGQVTPDQLLAYGAQGLAILPLILDERPLGAISLSWDKAHYFTPSETRIYQTLALLAAPLMAQTALVETRRRQGAAIRRFKSLAKTVSLPLAVLDGAGIHTYANQAYHELLGYEFQQRGLIGQPVSHLFSAAETGPGFPEADLETILAGWSGQKVMQRRDGSRFEASLTSLTMGDEVGSVAIYLEDVGQVKAEVDWLEIQRYLTRQLNHSPHIAAALLLCLKAALKATGMDRGRLYLVDQHRPRLSLVAHQGVPAGLEQQASLLEFGEAAAEPLTRQTPVYAAYADINADPRLAAGDPAARAVAIVPVIDQERLAAVFHLAATETEQIARATPARLEAIAAQLGHVLRRSRLETEFNQSQTLAAVQQETLQDKTAARLLAARNALEQELAEVKTGLDTDLQALEARLLSTVQEARQQSKARLEQLRTEAENRYNHLFETTSDWVWTIDPNGQITRSNPAIESLLGYPAETVIGASIFEMIQPGERTPLHARLMQHMVQLEPNQIAGWTDLEISWLHRDGFVRPMFSTLRPLFDQQGYLTGFQGVERAITRFILPKTSDDTPLASFQILAGVAGLLGGSGEMEARFLNVATFLQTQLRLSHVQLYTFNEAALQLVLRTCAGEAAALLQMAGHRISLHHKESLVARAARHRQVMLVTDVQREPNFAAHPLMPETRSEISVPLVAGRRLLGVLDLHAEQADRFSQAEVEFLQVLAVYLALALG